MRLSAGAASSMEHLSVEGLDAALAAVEGRSGDVYLLFCGGQQPETGESWCPDCVKADPVIRKVAADQKSGVLIHCSVGERDKWKDSQNPFRKHPKLLLKAVPTLLKWNSAKRLVEEECASEDLVRMMFEED